MKKTITAIAISLSLSLSAAGADEIGDRLKSLAEKELAQAFNETDIVEAVKAQNSRHANLGQEDIDKLDKQWRAQAKSGSGSLIDAVLGNALSGRLKQIKESGGGLYTEIFVMDNKGLNVGQSDVTSDYWQGDESKWQKTFSAGPGSIFVDAVEFDESTQTYQAQISLTLVDPATNTAVGAVTVGVNVEALQ
ncbi:MAG: hypothetical protein KDK91_01500 [Gammaproteobacteria bacterium]|nr:hypothetical protein [Gammaproteobacteria bacterium]